MKLTFRKVVIADHHDSGVSGLDLGSETQIQTVEYFRGKEVRSFDRGNRSVSGSFTVARIHPSVREAEVYLFDHPQTILGVDVLTVETIDTHRARTVREITNCALARAKGRYTGCTTFFEYSFTGNIATTPKR